MLEQIKQVANTYLTQRMFWFIAALFALMVLPNMALMFGPQRSTKAGTSMLFLVGMPLFFVVPFLVGHVKMQFAHSRARLIPNFYPAHVAVVGAVLLTLLVLYPLTVVAAGGAEPLGILALILSMGASMVWGTHLNRMLPILFGLVLFYSLMTHWGMSFWVLEAANYRGPHAIIAASGAALVVAWLWRLCHLREEDDDYRNALAAALARRSGAETVEERRNAAWQVGRNRLTSRIGDWWHSRLGGYYGGSPTGRSHVLRFGFAPIPIEVHSVIIALMLVCYSVFLRQFASSTNNFGNLAGNPLILLMAVTIPGIISGRMMAQRRTRIANEMLLPVSRTQLIDSLFAVSAVNSAKVWLLLNGTLGLLVLLSQKDMAFQTSVVFALLSATISFTTFGMSMRSAIWPSMFKQLLAIWFSMFIFGSPIIIWATEHKKWGDTPFLGIAIVLAVIGSLLLRSARRVWLSLEFA